MRTHLPARLVGRTGVALVAVLLAAGTAVAGAATGSSPQAPGLFANPAASHAPESEEPDESGKPEAPASAQDVDRIVGLLKDHGITTSSSDFKALADQVGVGGAVRVLAFAKASGKTPAEIIAMFKAGEGWGKIAHDLKISSGPGIGWIMGHGKH